MNRFFIKFSRKRIKRIPKNALIAWVVCAVSLLALIIDVVIPYKSIESLQCKEIPIDDIYLFNSYETKGSRIRLNIVSDGMQYFVWYPQERFDEYSNTIEQDLLSGNVVSVQVRIPEKRNFRDKLLNQYRIFDLRTDSSVYYSVDDEIDRIYCGQRWQWVICATGILFWCTGTIIMLLIYKVISFHKR